MQAIGGNIKKLRDEQCITQKQLADKLGISFQAVSKWETGATLPDSELLPSIALFFNVTIDDLFMPRMTAYRNKAERLAAVYEADVSNRDAFLDAEREYMKLFSSGKYTECDAAGFAYVAERHARFYLETAERYYKEAVEIGAASKSEAYYKNQRQYILFLSRIGRSQESIDVFRRLVDEEPENPMNYISLTAAYKFAGDLQNALNTAQKGLFLYPDNALLLTYAGDIMKNLGDIESAKDYWERAYVADNDMIDAKYSLASYYIGQNIPDKAENELRDIIAWNNERGFEVENVWAERELSKISVRLLSNN